MGGKSFETICNELIETVKKDIFPADAEFVVPDTDIHTGNYICYIFWLLNDDKSRPQKTSRRIAITITEEAIDNTTYHKHKKDIQQQFKKFITEKLKNFNPHHNNPEHSPPSPEEWLIENGKLQ